MTNPTKKPTVAALKKWARANKSLAKAVLMAEAFAEVERERVDAYIEPLFKTFGFINTRIWKCLTCTATGRDEAPAVCPSCTSERDANHGPHNPLIEHSDKLYMSDEDERVKEFYAACDKAHREHGFDGPEGHCPALVAENLAIEAENALLEELAKFMGVESMWVTLEGRKKALDIALGVCLKDPK